MNVIPEFHNPTICTRFVKPYRLPMNIREAAVTTLTGAALRRSLLVALVVGTALNIINQGPEMLSGKAPVLWKMGLTYVVPFLVASYGSYAAFRSSH